MSKLEFKNNHLKNAKINNKQLKKICHFFALDFTASQTSKELSLSRQTINSYYKTIRMAILEEKENIDSITLNNEFKKNNFVLKYMNIHTHTIYYIEYKSKPYILDSKNTLLKEISNFVKCSINNSLKDHKKANAARILYDTHYSEYFIASFLKTPNNLEEYIDIRLKKFRGLNKNNISIHINESILRFNNNETIIFNTLTRIFNL